MPVLDTNSCNASHTDNVCERINLNLTNILLVAHMTTELVDKLCVSVIVWNTNTEGNYATK